MNIHLVNQIFTLKFVAFMQSRICKTRSQRISCLKRSLKGFLKHAVIFKLRLGALIPRSVGLSVCLSVGPPKITKKLQNFTKPYKTFQTIQDIVTSNAGA